MLKSCKYCGRVHDDKIICTQKKRSIEIRQSTHKDTDAFRFRRSNEWTNKSITIRKRDRYICLCCEALMVGTVTQYNTRDLSVHHITPINEDFDQRLDDRNLITVCETHHEMCEAGEISRDQQRWLVSLKYNDGEGCDPICY